MSEQISPLWEGSAWRIEINDSFGIPGYLFLKSKNNDATEFKDLSPVEFSELCLAMRLATVSIESVLSPLHLFVGKFGLVPGHNIHFHAIPVFPWMLEGFDNEPTYKQLQQRNPDGYPAVPDAAELIAYFWRELCFQGRKLRPFDAVSVEAELRATIANLAG